MTARINNGKIPGYDPKRDAEGFHFDKDRADMACDFFSECLTHIKGAMAGEPFEQEPFQRAVTRNIFGWVDDEGLRRYRTVFCYWPRKNGKSTWSAGIGTYILFCDDEPGAEIYSAAAESKQATIVFNMAKDMVLNDPDLSSRCKIYNRSILIEETGAIYFQPDLHLEAAQIAALRGDREIAVREFGRASAAYAERGALIQADLAAALAA